MKLIPLKCPECLANLEIEEGRNSCFCHYCGCKILLDDEKKETIITKNVNINKNINHTERKIDEADLIRAKTEADNRKDSKQYAIVGLIILILLSIFLILWNPEEESHEGMIRAGTSTELIGKNFETVEAHFKAAGFTDIELIDLDDSGLLFWTDGEVESISIGGLTSFDSDDWFSPSDKVLISHH